MKPRDLDIPKELSPCTKCGAEDSIYKDQDYHLVESDPDIDIVVCAYVCKECGQTGYHGDVYAQVLEAREAAEGRPYRKVEIAKGKIKYYTLH